MDAGEVQNAALSQSKALLESANNAIANIATAAAGGFYVNDSGWYTGTVVASPGSVSLTEPSLTGVADVPDFGDTVTVDAVTIGDMPDPGDFDVSIPAINIPASPVFVEPSRPGNAPVLEGVTIPEAPGVLDSPLPDAPVIPSVSILDMEALPSYSFSESLPTDDLVAPSERFSFSEVDYESSLLTLLQGKLANDLENGGYGIEPLDEAALWERERERELRNMNGLIEDAARQTAARGFATPPGVMNLLIQKAEQEGLAKVSSVNRDIGLKRADLYVQNRQFIIQQTQQLEQSLITYHGYKMERLLKAAQITVELAISSYNAQVAMHNLRLERYKAAASVYETLIRSNQNLVEQYRAYIEGVKAKLSVTQVQAEIYRAQLQGLEQAASVYRTKMQAAQIAAEIERLRLDAFKTSVETYSIGVQANMARFNAFEAQIKGETAKLDAAKVKAETLAAKANAYKSRADIVLAEAQAKIAVNTAKLEEFRSKVAAYEARVHGIGLKNQTVTGVFDSKLKARIAKAELTLKGELGRVEASKAQADVAVGAAKVKLATAQMLSTTFVTNMHNTISAYTSVANALGTAAGHAFNAAAGIEAQITNK